MPSRPPLPRLAFQSPLQSTAQSVLVATSLLLLLTWLGAWVFELHPPLVLTATLGIVMLGLLAIGVRVGVGWRNGGNASARLPSGGLGSHGAHVIEPDPESHAPSARIGQHWSLDVFTHIDAQRFAAVCETWFSLAGFDTRHEAHRTQEGVDIWLHTPRLPGPVAIVRCKHARDKPVGLQELREFQGVVSSCQRVHGTFTTTSTYTPEALQFAEDNGIEVVDGRALLRRILTRSRQSQQMLLAVACHGR